MRLQARLAKMEKTNVVNNSNLRQLTDKELAESLKFNLEGFGINWEEFKKDPSDAVKRRFEGVRDDEGLCDRVLDLIDKTDSCWYELAG